jgi:Xaa-Pro dipeptidase
VRSEGTPASLRSPVFLDARKRSFLNAEGADKPLRSPIPHDTLVRARGYRLARLRAGLAAADCAGALLYDPINIRYALDCPNMQVWTLHNPVRYALIFAAGPAILFEFRSAMHLARGLETIDELRPAKSWIYMTDGERVPDNARAWAGEIAALVREHGGGNRRVAIDRLEFEGHGALAREGLTLVDGAPINERARSIKSDDEIVLMGWTLRVCEAGMARMYEHSLPGISEQELWAHLHFENARSGGEWIETRLLTCGPRTNPWYSECSDRPCGLGEMIAFDTDMIGPYGYCADLSRSWTCGFTAMTGQQRRLYMTAVEQIEHNLGVIGDGVSFAEFNEKSWRVPERHQPYRYSLAAHGVGMADEWPLVPLHMDFASAHGGQFEKGMVICVESLIAEAGSESVKLETQVLVTEQGVHRLDTFPWENLTIPEIDAGAETTASL